MLPTLDSLVSVTLLTQVTNSSRVAQDTPGVSTKSPTFWQTRTVGQPGVSPGSS